mmetsp:Transcript_6073/g.15509  ORF Transcript_6073/g.15509 Transcript_6073/m.15509 type:complete len:253 (+) Transcript_6073:271-1029(+)
MPLNIGEALDKRYDAAIESAKRAIAADDAKEYQEALAHYCTAIEAFLAVTAAGATWVGQLLRPRIDVYCHRAEHIKAILAGKTKTGGGGGGTETDGAGKRARRARGQPCADPAAPTAEQQRTEALQRRLASKEREATHLAAEVAVLTAKVHEMHTALHRLKSAHPSSAHHPSHANRPPEHFCPVSKRLLQDPVLTTCGCGVSVEHDAARRWWGGGAPSCPACRAPLASTAVFPNVALRNLVRRWGALAGSRV